MTKLNTLAYYDACGKSNKLIPIDTTYTNAQIEECIKDYIYDKKISNTEIDVIHIEIFHNDAEGQSYMLKAKSNDLYDLYYNMCKQEEDIEIKKVIDIITTNLPHVAKSPYERYVDSCTDAGTYVIKKFDDEEYSEIMSEIDLIKYYDSNPEDDKILGVFKINGVYEIHPINHADKSAFQEILDLIKDEELKLYASVCLNVIPEYVFEIPTGNNCRKRTASDMSSGGLLRHLIHTARLVDWFTHPDYAKIIYTEHEIDMMLIAAMFHDTYRYGWNKSADELFEHPRIAANVLREIKGIIPENRIKFITSCIESHMGSCNQNSDNPECLPLPVADNKYKFLVELADYISTRKNLIFVENDDSIYAFNTQKIIAIENFIPLDKADRITLENAMIYDVNMDAAKALGITATSEEIKQKWEEMISQQRYIDSQQDYITLAKKMMYI